MESLFAQTLREQDALFYATFPAAAAARHKEMYGAELYYTSPTIADYTTTTTTTTTSDEHLLRTPPLQQAYYIPLNYHYQQSPIIDGPFSPTGTYAHPPETPSDFSAGSPRSDVDDFSDSGSQHQLYPVHQHCIQQQQQQQPHFQHQHQYQHFQHQDQDQHIHPLYQSSRPPSTHHHLTLVRQPSLDGTSYPSRPSAPPPHLLPSSRHQAQPSAPVPPLPQTATATVQPAASMRLSPLPSKRQLEKKPPLACLFCRGRKIACGAPLPGSTDKTCNQCQRRSLPCEYPSESRRGMRKKKTEPAPEILIDPKNPLAGLPPLPASPVVVKTDQSTPVLSSKPLL